MEEQVLLFKQSGKEEEKNYKRKDMLCKSNVDKSQNYESFVARVCIK